MISLLFSNPVAFLITAIGLVIAITIHEFAHAFAADHLGDPTPRAQGRLTLNPLSHLDPIGTLALLFVGFGWGKPVEFDPYNLKHKTSDTALIALAGPVSNIILAVILALAKALLLDQGVLDLIFSNLILINLILAVFNLVPIAPLDGEKILYAVLDGKTAIEYRQFMNQYGTFILLALIFPIFSGVSPISRLITPIVNFLFNLIT